MVVPAELATQATCYGLPFGMFGIFCWSFTFFSVSLTHANCPVFTPWKWGKDYKAQSALLMTVSTILILGPTIYTCFKCRSEWIMLLVALGQLTPWSLKIMNDGFVSLKYDDDNGLWKSYKMAGIILTIPFSLVGWIGMTALSISLMKTEMAVSVWIWSLYLVALIAMMLTCLVENLTFRFSMIYIFATIHIIGSHVIFALITGHWGGLATTGDSETTDPSTSSNSGSESTHEKKCLLYTDTVHVDVRCPHIQSVICHADMSNVPRDTLIVPIINDLP
ncbi:9001_t:CDS:2 [Diversispora eburnea]|uniref:9001_t:CDS:1 n=1 Tax=Diversispora eburnea TaxID=1213867 RepID=A0A9N8VSX5_9GLOM|nr:9001_t:CDS:2 [Diversispora eburnea]